MNLWTPSLKSGQRPVLKVHETLAIWSITLVSWHLVFSKFATGIDNFEYLQWGATALTVVLLSKHSILRDHLQFTEFLGNHLNKRAVPEIAYTTALAVILGVGSWSILVFIEAQVNLSWTIYWWGLMASVDFEKIRWLKSWLIIDAIAGAVLIPITEEIIFRGFILRRLASKYDVRVAILISSLIFALFHVNKNFLGSFFHGVLFATLAIRFASLYVPMVVHGSYNTLVFVAETVFGTFRGVDLPKIGSISYWASELIFLVVGIFFLTVYFRHALRSLQFNPYR